MTTPARIREPTIRPLNVPRHRAGPPSKSGRGWSMFSPKTTISLILRSDLDQAVTAVLKGQTESVQNKDTTSRCGSERMASNGSHDIMDGRHCFPSPAVPQNPASPGIILQRPQIAFAGEL